ncbi:MAG TPA: bifunctional diguanylate cyclase/phosphodiesterase [Mycobacterium sp.]|nr:bifunctional diguanylate cyclase/phosphodiesterase [Mycobacterium sp.]
MLIITAVALVVVNSLALWGDEPARRLVAALQFATGAGAVSYGLVTARRAHGASRTWRLLAVGALASLMVAELAWWTNWAAVRPAGVVAYFLFPLLVLASVLLLARAGGAVTGSPDGSPSHTVVTTALDGLVAAMSFAILVIIGGFGVSTAAWPRSGNPALETVYALLELVLVVVACVIGMVYRSEQRYRANYLLLACGVVLIAASDRLVAYFDSVGGPTGQLWCPVGFVLGALLIAFGVRDVPQAEAGVHRRGLDWAQLVLPYSGFLGITVLLAFHLLTGNRLDAVVVSTTVVVVILVAARQAVAMDAQRKLTRRLYEAQRGLAYQVLHDAMTGLPNRLFFGQRLDDAMHGGRFMLIFVDLDDFKEVNDRFGHAAGDELLRAVGDRLQRCVTDADTLARIGGDEFAILIGGGLEKPEVVADRLRVALRAPFAVQGSSLRVRASMGLVRSSSDGLSQTSDDLLRQADVSMYASKRLGKNTAVVYQPTSGVQADFPSALRAAAGGIPEGFSLAFQPVVHLPEGTPVAVEALARWTAPNGIHISPQAFVAVAEAAGLGAVLDAMVLDMACGQVEEAGLDVNIHVNIGAARLGNPGFEQHVRQTLARYRIPPGRLVVEITETVPIVDLSDAAAQIKRLNAIGVKVALDDFGAGYNSLTYLHGLPVQIVKVDRSLVVGGDPARDVALYRSVIGLCEAMNLVVIAEGIETAGQAETVYNAGCRLAQGHLFGTPVPITELGAGAVARRKPL